MVGGASVISLNLVTYKYVGHVTILVEEGTLDMNVGPRVAC